MANSGTRVGPWHRCDRCGEQCRVGDLTRQRGLLLCTEAVNGCLDNPIAWQRDAIIAETLSSGTPEPGVAPILSESDAETDDYAR